MIDTFFVRKLKLANPAKIPIFLESGQKLVFVADVHIDAEPNRKIELFANFLKNLSNETHSLFILGDLFNYYVTSPQEMLACYKPIFEQTKRLAEQGTRVYFTTGNRDFLVHNELSKFGIFTLPLWTQIIVRNLDNSFPCRMLLTHGEILMQKDRAYKFYRSIVRSSIFYGLARILPMPLKFSIAKLMPKFLGAKTYAPVSLASICDNLDFLDAITKNAVEKLILSEFADVLIFGHWHLRADLALRENKQKNKESEQKKRVIITGDWREDEGAVLEYQNSVFRSFIFR